MWHTQTHTPRKDKSEQKHWAMAIAIANKDGTTTPGATDKKMSTTERDGATMGRSSAGRGQPPRREKNNNKRNRALDDSFLVRKGVRIRCKEEGTLCD